jgi:hypothetical protein
VGAGESDPDEVLAWRVGPGGVDLDPDPRVLLEVEPFPRVAPEPARGEFRPGLPAWRGVDFVRTLGVSGAVPTMCVLPVAVEVDVDVDGMTRGNAEASR